MMITSQTRKIALVGSPIEHSRSPEMMNAAFREMNVPYMYMACHVQHGKLKKAVEGLKSLEFIGWNVTLPYKIEIRECIDVLDETAREIGAVNTVVNRSGRWVGYNTDGEGYIRSLMEETDLDLSNQKVVILGAGGAARAVGYSLARHGVQKLTFANRTIERAEELASRYAAYVKTNSIVIGKCRSEIAEATLLINTTSVGMYPHENNFPVDPSYLHPDLTVSDIVYNPRETAFLSAARKKKTQIHYGLGMLVHQAATAIELWTGKKAPTEWMKTVLERS